METDTDLSIAEIVEMNKQLCQGIKPFMVRYCQAIKRNDAALLTLRAVADLIEHGFAGEALKLTRECLEALNAGAEVQRVQH